MMIERLNMLYVLNVFNGEKCFRIVDKFRLINILLKKIGVINRYLIIVYRDYLWYKICLFY